MKYLSISELKSVYQSTNDHRLPMLAQACAFNILLSLIPLMLIGIALLGFLIGNQQHALHDLIVSIRSFIPIQTNFLKSLLQNVLEHKKVLGLFGLIGLFISVQGAFMVLEEAMDQIWGVPDRRKWYIKRGVAFVATLISLVLLGMNFALSALATDSYKRYFPTLNAGYISPFVVVILPLVLTTLLFYWLYKLLPSASVHSGSALKGALVAAVIWQILKLLFGYIVARFAPYNRLYGSLSELIALVLWVDYSVLALLFGVELSVLFSRRAGVPEPIEKAAIDPLAPSQAAAKTDEPNRDE